MILTDVAFMNALDLVKLSVDGNSQNRKWLIYDASFDYEVGVFDGKSMITISQNTLET